MTGKAAKKWREQNEKGEAGASPKMRARGR